jgi:hypothetical protein
MGLRMSNTGKAFGILAGLCLAGCYNTKNVASGGLLCGADDACPAGFSCLDGHCWRNGTGPDAGTGRRDTQGGAPDTLPPKTDTGAPPLACTTPVAPFGPFPSCTSPVPLPGVGSTCDPVCQSGCACDRRCVVESTTLGGFVCEGSAQAPSTFISVLGDCSDPRSASCLPGSICVGDDFCPNLCYRTCRRDADCPKGSLCSLNTLLDINYQPVDGVALCTPPTEACNPIGPAPCLTPRDKFNCVFQAGLTGVSTDATTCDCGTLHNKKLGAACSMTPDDCLPGLVCVEKTCRTICDVQTMASCSGLSRCTAVFGSTKYGYCK